MTALRVGKRHLNQFSFLVLFLGLSLGATASLLPQKGTFRSDGQDSRPTADAGFLSEESSATSRPRLTSPEPDWSALQANPLQRESSRRLAPAAEAAPVGEPASLETPEASTPLAGIRLVEAETWDSLSRANVDRALSLLPSSVIARLGNPDLGDLLIIVSPDGSTSTGSRPYKGPANFFFTNEGRNEVVLYPGQPVLTLHELGHAFNLRHSPAADYASVLLGDEMISFMAATGWTVRTPAAEVARLRDHSLVEFAYAGEPVWEDLSRQDQLEDFANIFALYFAAPDQLLELSPVRYAWFAALIPR